jgi:hypothetical protein
LGDATALSAFDKIEELIAKVVPKTNVSTND